MKPPVCGLGDAAADDEVMFMRTVPEEKVASVDYTGYLI